MKYKKILFVCSGNQCRSPMAEGILKDMVKKDKGWHSSDIEITSAGTLSHVDGASATYEAITVMGEQGIDISLHKAKYITTELCRQADLILVMKPEHKSHIIERFEGTSGKVHILTEFVGEAGYVEDPIGLGIEAYRQCADTLRSLLTVLKRQMQGAI